MVGSELTRASRDRASEQTTLQKPARFAIGIFLAAIPTLPFPFRITSARVASPSTHNFKYALTMGPPGREKMEIL
jgi:hypothetical protein